jgi:hypothetical protein
VASPTPPAALVGPMIRDHRASENRPRCVMDMTGGVYSDLMNRAKDFAIP